ncbi:unnamed protein product [Peronospora belbahrii]|uniref:Uncharacterized protein n=1 Tax=Peronospora belbahrii TaxID=622444 RepID=A0ABN8CL38_9STRA|nr:unnamed protein product [Peronospora belbahrii]
MTVFTEESVAYMMFWMPVGVYRWTSQQKIKLEALIGTDQYSERCKGTGTIIVIAENMNLARLRMDGV